ncbi:hypothetical protein Q8A67_009606 [Cirrhinus molitorella]|uniref:Uncharacterized protein n=1 Tax=Cirrhinus molitorella TaxID=172907 RepID=A0AA88TTG0_9TELE|nr:hypothetical protein Q8A67_009606 [Cirrhinus molitorella]
MSSLHTISEHAEPDESLELACGAQGDSLSSKKWRSILKGLRATRHRDRRTTKQIRKSRSISADRSALKTSRKQVDLPQWLVNLMHNIEEATTHELTIE